MLPRCVLRMFSVPGHARNCDLAAVVGCMLNLLLRGLAQIPRSDQMSWEVVVVGIFVRQNYLQIVTIYMWADNTS